MNKAQAEISRMRLKARRGESDKPYHVYSTSEEKIHTLEITTDTVSVNSACSFMQPGSLCFCEPWTEDYTDSGGGVLVIHRQVQWQ
mgnify:CR=1 FL=1